MEEREEGGGEQDTNKRPPPDTKGDFELAKMLAKKWEEEDSVEEGEETGAETLDGDEETGRNSR